MVLGNYNSQTNLIAANILVYKAKAWYDSWIKWRIIMFYIAYWEQIDQFFTLPEAYGGSYNYILAGHKLGILSSLGSSVYPGM